MTKARTFIGNPCRVCGGRERYTRTYGVCVRCAKARSRLAKIRRKSGRLLEPPERSDIFRGLTATINGGRPGDVTD